MIEAKQKLFFIHYTMHKLNIVYFIIDIFSVFRHVNVLCEADQSVDTNIMHFSHHQEYRSHFVPGYYYVDF